jgi:hypothetical protein
MMIPKDRRNITARRQTYLINVYKKKEKSFDILNWRKQNYEDLEHTSSADDTITDIGKTRAMVIFIPHSTTVIITLASSRCYHTDSTNCLLRFSKLSFS